MSALPAEISALLEGMSLRHHPRARRLRLRVVPPGRLEVTLPRGVGRSAAVEMVHEHQAWILQQLERHRQRERRWLHPPEALQLAALGENWQIEPRLTPQRRPGVRALGPGRLQLCYPLEGEWRAPLRGWLQQQGRKQLGPWLERVSVETGLTYTGLSVRGQKSRWGSCSSRGRINLNFALLLLPPELVRYVLIHELCHTRHLNHGAAFWQLVARHEPDYRQREAALRRVGAALEPWWHIS